MMFPGPSRHPGVGPNPPGASGGPMKLGAGINETCERIKEEFNYIQSQYHNLKLECEKLAQDKTEMQRHYVMYYEMSYGLNVEMHKQTEICKRLDAIIRQVLPFLNGEHQQQVAVAVERAKQITMTELTALMQAAGGPGGLPGAPPGLPGAPPAGLPGVPGLGASMPGLPPGFPPSSAAGLLSLAGGHPGLPGLPPTSLAQLMGHRTDLKDEKPMSAMEERLKHSSSASPARRDSRDHRPKSPGISARSPIRSSTPNDEIAAKKMKMESDLRKSGHESDSGDKSDGDLVVDVGGDEEGARRPLENGDHPDLGDRRPDRDRPPSNMSSSSRSTPSLKNKDADKPGTPNDLPPGSKSQSPPRAPPLTPASAPGPRVTPSASPRSGPLDPTATRPGPRYPDPRVTTRTPAPGSRPPTESLTA